MTSSRWKSNYYLLLYFLPCHSNQINRIPIVGPYTIMCSTFLCNDPQMFGCSFLNSHFNLLPLSQFLLFALTIDNFVLQNFYNFHDKGNIIVFNIFLIINMILLWNNLSTDLLLFWSCYFNLLPSINYNLQPSPHITFTNHIVIQFPNPLTKFSNLLWIIALTILLGYRL